MDAPELGRFHLVTKHRLDVQHRMHMLLEQHKEGLRSIDMPSVLVHYIGRHIESAGRRGKHILPERR
ncbi:hypothetical protein OKW50_001859 [Paraburkholderia youngii]|uniref:Uncharacterized protein n=1 Tax=Paraburkholderia youngii TaxID=2782701 RepID=A0A7W8L266_9BURK|nr:hypothetical protein [Paraburkholderia youngii]